MHAFSLDFWGKDEGCEEESDEQISQKEGSRKGRFYNRRLLVNHSRRAPGLSKNEFRNKRFQ